MHGGCTGRKQDEPDTRGNCWAVAVEVKAELKDENLWPPDLVSTDGGLLNTSWSF